MSCWMRKANRALNRHAQEQGGALWLLVLPNFATLHPRQERPLSQTMVTAPEHESTYSRERLPQQAQPCHSPLPLFFQAGTQNNSLGKQTQKIRGGGAAALGTQQLST